jgi:hypothetical protein
MSTRRSRPPRAKKARTAETEPLLNDVLDASAAPPMLSPPPSEVTSVLSVADELAMVDAAWDEMLA